MTTMTTLDRVLRRAGARLFLLRLIRTMVVCATIAVAALVVLRSVERLLAFPMDWQLAWIISLSAAAVGAITWTVVTRPDRLGVARTVDEDGELRETLSTAMCVRDRDDAWSKAAVGAAEETAQRVVVRRVFPLAMPRLWPAPILGVGVFLLLGVLPSADLLNRLASADQDRENQQAIEQANTKVQEIEEELEDSISKIDDEKLAAELEALEKPDAHTPEDITRAAMKKLTAMKDRLAELRSDPNNQMLDRLRKQMEMLRAPNSLELGTLAQALQQGDFSKANEALNKMLDKLASGELSAQQQQELASQLQDLANQLSDLAQQQSALENALAEAGIDPKLAGNPDALRNAMQSMDGMTDAQRQQLQHMANAMQNAGQMCQSMSQSCSGAASSMQSGQMGMGELSSFGDQLSSLEMMQMQMQQLDAASGQCDAQMSQLAQMMSGFPKQGPGSQPGMSGLTIGQIAIPGSGQRGFGGGTAPPPQETGFTTDKIKAKSPRQKGPIVGTMLVDGGDNVRGESKQQFSKMIEQSREAFDSAATEESMIPREFHESVKKYYEELAKSGGDEGGDVKDKSKDAPKDD